MRRILIIILFFPLIISCRSTQYSPKNFKGAQLIAGSSGGVTGMLKEFVLLENGQVFLSNGLNGEWKEMPKLKKSKTKRFFSKAGELDLSHLKFRHPGNMTYYLILKNPSRTYEIRWGESGISPPEGIQAFYNELISLINP